MNEHRNTHVKVVRYVEKTTNYSLSVSCESISSLRILKTEKDEQRG